MTNTIPNVPRELLERAATSIEQRMCIQCEGVPCCMPESLNTLSDIRALLSTPSPAGVGGLEVIGHIDSDDDVSGSYAVFKNDCDLRDGTELVRLPDAQTIIDGLRGEVADLHTTMMAAAVEIQEHWAAHCDEDGYGPANLMHRLERGIASQYGYSAETLVRLESQHDQHAQRIGELETALEFACKSLAQVTSSDGSGHADIAVSVLRMAGRKEIDASQIVEAYKAGAKWRIDAALSSGKKGE